MGRGGPIGHAIYAPADQSQAKMISSLSDEACPLNMHTGNLDIQCNRKNVITKQGCSQM